MQTFGNHSRLEAWDSVSCRALKNNLFLLGKNVRSKSYIKSSKQVGLVAYLKSITTFDQMVKKSPLNRIDPRRK